MRRWGKKKLYTIPGQLNTLSLRSGFEAKIAANLLKDGLSFEYEPRGYAILLVEVGRQCVPCGASDIRRKARYTPDFWLPVGATYVESKGRLTAKERKIILAFRDQVAKPLGFGYAVLLQRDNKLSKTSKTRYSDWLKKNGIPYAIGERIPPKWALGDFTP